MALDPYPLFSIFAFFGTVLPLIPLPWHLEAWNSGTVYFMLWASLGSLNQLVNSIIWHNTAADVAPIWCDISIRIMFGTSVGIPAASLCINRRLFSIARMQSVTLSRNDKLRSVIVDTLLCVVMPIVFIALQYIVQGHRYDIYENIGCFPALYNTYLVYILNFTWPLAMGTVSAVYCVLTLTSFMQRRLELSRFMASNKSLTISRYVRLMSLTMTELLLTVPLSIMTICVNTTAHPLDPWLGFADAHFAFSRVMQYPVLIYGQNPLITTGLEFTRWMCPVSALLVFGYFGSADEAIKHYRLAYWAIAKVFGRYPPLAVPAKYMPSSMSGFKLPVISTTFTMPNVTKAAPPPSPPPAYTSPSNVSITPLLPTTPSSLATLFSTSPPSSPGGLLMLPPLPHIPRVSRDSYQPGTPNRISVSEYSTSEVPIPTYTASHVPITPSSAWGSSSIYTEAADLDSVSHYDRCQSTVGSPREFINHYTHHGASQDLERGLEPYSGPHAL